MPAVLTRDESHIYRADGNIKPGVTTMLKTVGIIAFKNIPPALLAEKADLGTKVHLATELDDIGDLDEATLDPAIKPYLTGWRKFRKQTGFKPDAIEEIVHNEIYGYMGTLDRRGPYLGHPAIVDIKTGTKQRWHGVQLALYCLANVQHLGRKAKRLSVYLPGNDEYSVEEHGDSMDFDVGLSAVTVYNYIMRGKK